MRRLSEEISRMPLPQGISVDVVDMDGVNRSLPNVTHVMVDTKGGDKLKTLEEIIVVSYWISFSPYLILSLFPPLCRLPLRPLPLLCRLTTTETGKQ
jgi:hypothetical protein